MPRRKPIDYSALAKKLGRTFVRPELLEGALTHPSLLGLRGVAAGSQNISSYERLEFLGDRVLGLVVAHWLYELYPDANEGELAKRHASLVSREALTKIATKINLEEHVRFVAGHHEKAPRKNIALLSDALEGIIGALYLDGGILAAEGFIKKQWGDSVVAEIMPTDPKTALQEYAQGLGLPLPIYTVVDRTGPAHAPKFRVRLQVSGIDSVESVGGAKREAEKQAAALMLQRIREAQ